MEKFDPKPEGNKKSKGKFDTLKTWAKIGAVASIGLFAKNGQEQKIKNPEQIEHKIESKKKNLLHTTNDGFSEIKTNIDTTHRTLSMEEFLKSNYFKQEQEPDTEKLRTLKHLVSVESEKLRKMKNREGIFSNMEKDVLSFCINRTQSDINRFKELQKNMGRESSSVLFTQAKREVADAYKEYDKQHAWLDHVIKSQEYLDRLTQEQKGDKKIAETYRSFRMELLNDKDYKVVLGTHVDSNATGQFNQNIGTVEIASNQMVGTENVGIHEFAHDITNGGLFMSASARKLLTESFDETKLNQGEKIEYHNDPTERDARKKELEYDMEKLGIKKYGEVFTDKHYLELIQLQKQGKLSPGAEEFLRMTKPEYFKKIMNEIALNESETEIHKKSNIV